MKISPLGANYNSFARRRHNHAPNQARNDKFEKNSMTSMHIDLPDTVIIGIEQWDDGNYYPITAGQLKVRREEQHPTKKPQVYALVKLD